MFSGPDDDVSQSTMAAPSSKHWDANTMNSTAKGAPSEGMNATMTTIDAGEKLFLKPSMVSRSKKLHHLLNRSPCLLDLDTRGKERE